MSELPLAKLECYFTPEELELIEAGRDLPLTSKMLDELCLRRVGNTVLNGLIASIGNTVELTSAYMLVDSAPHPFMTDPSERIEISVGNLPAVKVNAMWELEVKFGVPINPDDIEETELLNPNPLKNGIQDTRGIIFSALTWRPTEAAYRKLGIGDDMLDIEQSAYDEQFVFTRVGDGYQWEARTSHTTAPELTSLLLLLGKSAGLPALHK